MCTIHQVVCVPCYVVQDLYRIFTEDEVSYFWSVLDHHSGSLESLKLKGMLPFVTSVECSSTRKQPLCVAYVIVSMSINIHHTHDMTRLSYTNAVSANYFLSVCAGCKVSQSCVVTILNKLPNLSVLKFVRLTLPELPANEREVSMHNVRYMTQKT